MHRRLLALCGAALATSLAAQSPQYHVAPALQPGDRFDTVLIGRSGQTYASLLDLGGGPRQLLGETFYLGFTPAMLSLDAGQLPPGGIRVLSIPTPTIGVMLGQPLYLQSLVLDGAASNGLFQVSDGESAVFYRSAAVIVEDFRVPVTEGITGTYNAGVVGRLEGGAVQRRTQVVRPLGAVPFGAGITGPLNPDGVRAQMVYRAADLGATGRPEKLVSVRWRPFAGSVVDDTFQRLVIEAVHSHVVPDYTVGLWSGLPVYPNSGLSATFSQNIKLGHTPTVIYDGSYAIRAANLRADGYLGYPAPQQLFEYNGIDSLLLDFKMTPSPTSLGTNAGAVYLMVQSSPRPNSRALDEGRVGSPVDPFQSQVASAADNALHDVQLEFARVESEAFSPWRAAPVAGADYGAPSVAASVPAGTELKMHYRGASSATGQNATPWSALIDVADTYPFLQWRATFVGDGQTGQVPSIDAIVIPVN